MVFFPTFFVSFFLSAHFWKYNIDICISVGIFVCLISFDLVRFSFFLCMCVCFSYEFLSLLYISLNKIQKKKKTKNNFFLQCFHVHFVLFFFLQQGKLCRSVFHFIFEMQIKHNKIIVVRVVFVFLKLNKIQIFLCTYTNTHTLIHIHSQHTTTTIQTQTPTERDQLHTLRRAHVFLSSLAVEFHTIEWPFFYRVQ